MCAHDIHTNIHTILFARLGIVPSISCESSSLLAMSWFFYLWNFGKVSALGKVGLAGFQISIFGVMGVRRH